jgi:hypothetical protein
MGFLRGFIAAPNISEATRRELLGQIMHLNNLMWILVACRTGGRARIPQLPGGEVGCGQERRQSGRVIGEGAGPLVFVNGQGRGRAAGGRAAGKAGQVAAQAEQVGRGAEDQLAASWIVSCARQRCWKGHQRALQ